MDVIDGYQVFLEKVLKWDLCSYYLTFSFRGVGNYECAVRLHNLLSILTSFNSFLLF